jgi:hypothetical protein
VRVPAAFVGTPFANAGNAAVLRLSTLPPPAVTRLTKYGFTSLNAQHPAALPKASVVCSMKNRSTDITATSAKFPWSERFPEVLSADAPFRYTLGRDHTPDTAAGAPVPIRFTDPRIGAIVSTPPGVVCRAGSESHQPAIFDARAAGGHGVTPCPRERSWPRVRP